MPIILLDLLGLDEQTRSRMQAAAPTLRIVQTKREAPAYRELLPTAQIIVGWPALDDLATASKLTWVALPSAGADRYVGNTPPHVTLTCARGVFGTPIAEHVLAMMLAFSIGFPRTMRNQFERRWEGPGRSHELAGSTCLIVGLGDIGKALAQRTHALGLRNLAIKRTPVACPSYVDRLGSMEDLDGMLPEADHIVLTLPGTRHTKHILNADRIARIRKGAFIYNIGRGSAIEESAMTEALRSGQLAGAGLDVFEKEPLPPESPLWQMPNVIITPHCAGNTPEHRRRFGDILIRNLAHWLQGQPLENTVDHDWGY